MFLSRSRPFVSQKHTRHYITNEFASLGHFSLHRHFFFFCFQRFSQNLMALNSDGHEARGETKEGMPPEALFVPHS